jgi:putative oxidoreductase
MKYVVPIGRLLYTAIFIPTVMGHFSSKTIAYAAHQGVPMAGFLVPASGIIATIGALSILFGYQAKIGAWLLVLFLVPVTLMMHNFWAVADPRAAGMAHTMFMKNMSMLGAALMITYFGAGPVSIDELIRNRRKANANG